MLQNAFSPRTRDLLVSQKTTQRHFFSPPSISFSRQFLQLQQWWHLHCFAILGSASIVIHSVKQRLLRNRPGSDAATSRDFLRLLARKITKGIYSCKPASVNRPIAQPRVHPNVPRPTKRRTLQNNKKQKQHKKQKRERGGGGEQGREVVVYWSLATLEMKAPMEGAETVSGGSVRVTVLGKNELRL